MRLGYRLSLALISATVLVGTTYGLLAIRTEYRELINHLKHETWIIVATLQPAVEFALDRKDQTQVQELLDSLGHQRILGAAIYRPDGSVLARSREMPELVEAPPPHPSQVLAEIAPSNAFIDLDGQRVFAYAVPLLDSAGRPHAVLAIYHLTGYLREDVRREVKTLLISLLTGIVVTAGLVIFIVDRAVSRPINRLIDQVMAIRRGDLTGHMPDAITPAMADGAASDSGADILQRAAERVGASVSPPDHDAHMAGGAPPDGADPDPERPREGVDPARQPAAQRPKELGGELGRLAAEFDRMAVDLARSREALIAEAEKRLSVERDLRHFERMAALGQLTSNLAHEVGTPLGVLRGRAEFLANDVSDHPEARREVESIIAQIDRITRTIERYLSASRPSPATAERIVGDELVRETAALVDLECRRNGIRLDVEPAAGEDSAILGQRDGLMQVLLNLSMNAVQAMKAGGVLRVASRLGMVRGAGALELEVTDTGAGMRPEVQKRVFEPFYSTRGTTGLGLFISRNIVREHGGVVTVDSEPERGSTFLVRIPLLNGGEAGRSTGDGAGDDPAERGTDGSAPARPAARMVEE